MEGRDTASVGTGLVGCQVKACDKVSVDLSFSGIGRRLACRGRDADFDKGGGDPLRCDLDEGRSLFLSLGGEFLVLRYGKVLLRDGAAQRRVSHESIISGVSLSRTMKVGQHIKILDVKNSRAPAFFILCPSNHVLIPGLPYAASPPFSKSADVP